MAVEAEVGTIAGVLGSAVAGAIAGAMAMRRRWSRDTAEVAQDSAHVNLLEHLQEERDDARRQFADALGKHIADSNRIASLAAENARLMHDVRRLRRLVPAEARAFMGTDPTPLDKS